MYCSMPGLPVLHYLLEFAQIHVHWISDAIQPSYPLSSPSPPVLNLPQHQGLFQWVSSSCQVAKVLQVQHHFFFLFFKYKFIYFNWRLITLQYCIDFAYIDMNLPWVYMCSPSWTPLPLPSPYHPSESSQCTSPEHPVSCIELRMAICLTYGNIHVSMPFSQIIPPLPSPTESKRLFYTYVSLLLSRIQGYHYHLSKFHIYVLVYCIGVYLSGLLHSV